MHETTKGGRCRDCGNHHEGFQAGLVSNGVEWGLTAVYPTRERAEAEAARLPGSTVQMYRVWPGGRERLP